MSGGNDCHCVYFAAQVLTAQWKWFSFEKTYFAATVNVFGKGMDGDKYETIRRNPYLNDPRRQTHIKYEV